MLVSSTAEAHGRSAWQRKAAYLVANRKSREKGFQKGDTLQRMSPVTHLFNLGLTSSQHIELGTPEASP